MHDQKDLKAAELVIRVIADAIRELGEVPSGHLYANLMSTGLTLNGFQSVLGILTKAGLIRVENHVITWIGKAATA